MSTGGQKVDTTGWIVAFAWQNSGGHCVETTGHCVGAVGQDVGTAGSIVGLITWTGGCPGTTPGGCHGTTTVGCPCLMMGGGG